ncbi:MAG: haloacid dehalogenase-like hydrolase [Planctomyces sp.]|nr:haloacid dehalogenase-like hydrolase [Planctomyces sp.]
MRVVLFDIDGTLLLSGGAGQRAMERALEQEFQVTRPTEDIPAAGRTDWAIVADLFRFHGIENSSAHWQRFVAAYLRQLPAALAELDGCVLPGVVALLEQLHPREDVRLGLLTGNLREGAWLKLKHYDIDHYFSFGAFGDAHHSRDDVAQLAFAECHKLAGSPMDADRVWVIGDTPADVACARAIGANVVAVATGIFSYDELERTRPDCLLHDLSDPAPLLSLLNGSSPA